ncbi:circadian clock KaiB family protein [Falsiroseomonas sp.]|uniref:circadian clock KaiB family protein n=1 Tax=Falsiroseomonas sp. TaxID=2870721 RepID=UPI003F711B38
MPDAAPRLRLYIAGSSPNSRKALANLAQLRAECPAADWVVETVDVFEQPQRALADGILMTPQLVILSEEGARAVVGDLGDRRALLAALAPDLP